jgi:hypothetical protein
MAKVLTSVHGRHVGLTASKALACDGLTFGEGSVVNATAATLAVKPQEHAGKLITLNRAGGIAVTLPAATGSGDVYEFLTGTTFTSNATIKVANASDIMVGFATFANNAANTADVWETAADSDTYTYDAAVAGLAGGRVTFRDVKMNGTTAVWLVSAIEAEDGTSATPFSATV